MNTFTLLLDPYVLAGAAFTASVAFGVLAVASFLGDGR